MTHLSYRSAAGSDILVLFCRRPWLASWPEPPLPHPHPTKTMKTNLLAWLLLAGFLTCASAAAAQAPAPPAASGGYWNLETNLTTRDYTLVRFYNAHDQLVSASPACALT